MIWKLLRQHISAMQLLGFFLANLFGMLIVLLAFQFYRDVRPVFSQRDGFIRNDYLIVSKRVAVMGFTSSTFSQREIDDLASQPFTKSIGTFKASQYKVSCSMGIEGVANFGTQMYFEAVPDQYVDTRDSLWRFREGDQVVPIILPRTYLAIYNFGFAQSRQLPKLSEGFVSMVDMTVLMRGDGKEKRMKAKIIGFSNRLGTILVPESFLDWSNREFAPDADVSPTRLIVEVGNPTDERIGQYVQQHGLDIDEDKLQAGKTTYFLRLVSAAVMAVGLLITLLSFFILMLSIYLLVEKNTRKLQNLLLLGYTPARVSLPYQLLTVGISLVVLALAMGLLWLCRTYYMQFLWSLFPTMEDGGLLAAFMLGLLLSLLVCLFNVLAIRSKVAHI